LAALNLIVFLCQHPPATVAGTQFFEDGTCYCTTVLLKQGMMYTQTEGDEVEDLYALLAYVKETIPSVTAVTTGLPRSWTGVLEQHLAVCCYHMAPVCMR
jgi:hypothetical protein